MLENIITKRTRKPPRIVIYGTEKIGKSSWAAQAESPIFITTEDGLGEIEVPHFPLATDYENAMTNVVSLIENDHEYKTCVIDSADWLERLIHAAICGKDNSESITQAAGGFGAGYAMAVKYWSEFLAALDYLRNEKQMAIIMIAHSQVVRFEDPESPAYDRHAPKLHKNAAAMINEWADAVLFATRKMRIVEQKEGFGKKRTTAAPIGASGGDRIIRCVGSPACVAGNRYGLPDELPLDYQAFADALAATM